MPKRAKASTARHSSKGHGTEQTLEKRSMANVLGLAVPMACLLIAWAAFFPAIGGAFVWDDHSLPFFNPAAATSSWSLWAVSYTHLDVYKRQERNGSERSARGREFREAAELRANSNRLHAFHIHRRRTAACGDRGERRMSR